jgi:hypothetical protein
MKCFYENRKTKAKLKKKAETKIKFECDVSDKIKESFENYFKKSGENKMNLFDFYQIIEDCEIDVSKSCTTLYDE